VNELLEKNQLGNIIFHSADWDCFSKEAKILTKKMLTKDPRSRIKLNDIRRFKWMKMKDAIMTQEQGPLNRIMIKNKSENSENATKTRKKSVFSRKSQTNFIEEGLELGLVKKEKSDNYILEEGQILTNPSNYLIKPRFLQENHNIKSFSSNLAFENYSVDYFNFFVRITN